MVSACFVARNDGRRADSSLPPTPAVRPPKVLLTTCYKPSKIMYDFLSEMLETLPEAEYYKRNGLPLKKIVKFASNRDFTDVMVFNENRKSINGLLLIHLPDGPTAHFRLSNLVLGRDIKVKGF